MSAVQSQLYEIARDALAAASLFGDKYRAMIKFIHDEKLESHEFTPVLKAAGWHASQISMMKRIAAAPKNIYSAYITKEINFRPALAAARENGEAKSPRGRKRQTLNKAWSKVTDTHAKAAKNHPKISGAHFFGDSVMIIFRLTDKFPLSIPAGKSGTISVDLTPPEGDPSQQPAE